MKHQRAAYILAPRPVLDENAIKTMAALAPQGKVYGVDSSPVMLAQARKRNIREILSGRIVLILGSFDDLPLPGASVDKILAVNVIYFWDNARQVVEEVRRVLRPGGLISIYATDASAMRHWKFAGPETHRSFDRNSLDELLQSGGFDSGRIGIGTIRTTKNISGLIATASKEP